MNRLPVKMDHEVYHMTESTRENRLNNVINTYSRRLFGFIRGRVSSNAEAEDILQDVWYQFSRVVDIEPIEQISAWLFRVARNRVTDTYRKKKPDLLEDYRLENDEGDFSIGEFLISEDNNPETELINELFWEELFEALEELPENQRLVFVENELEGKKLQQIADEQKENIKTIISRKGYAVKHLRTRLKGLYEELIKF